MKKGFILSLALLLSFYSSSWSSDTEEGERPHSHRKLVKGAEVEIIQNLFSKKFHYFGEKLNKEIQDIKNSDNFNRLTGIKETLEEMSKAPSTSDKENPGVKVTVFVKNNSSEENREDEELKKALLGAAYFPKELDPQTASCSLLSYAWLKFIQRQLADADFYGNPLAKRYLKQIASVCEVPLEGKFYQDFYTKSHTNLDEYTKYIVFFKLPAYENGVEAVEEEDINEKITFSANSPELEEYFLNLVSIERNPERRNKP